MPIDSSLLRHLLPLPPPPVFPFRPVDTRQKCVGLIGFHIIHQKSSRERLERGGSSSSAVGDNEVEQGSRTFFNTYIWVTNLCKEFYPNTLFHQKTRKSNPKPLTMHFIYSINCLALWDKTNRAPRRMASAYIGCPISSSLLQTSLW
jgi:hypothetical protein